MLDNTRKFVTWLKQKMLLIPTLTKYLLVNALHAVHLLWRDSTGWMCLQQIKIFFLEIFLEWICGLVETMMALNIIWVTSQKQRKQSTKGIFGSLRRAWKWQAQKHIKRSIFQGLCAKNDRWWCLWLLITWRIVISTSPSLGKGTLGCS